MTNNRTRNIIRLALLIGTIGSLFTVPWIIVWAWILPVPDTIQEQVEEALNYGFEGVIVYVDKADETPAFYTAGYHNSEEKIPANPDALFKIASISKLYVAVAITKLVHNQQLDLDQTLLDYFPELDGRIAYANEITLRMMVQHRSGIPNYTDQENFWIAPPTTAQETLELIFDLPATFKPGKGYAYSNTNYLLLRELIKKTVGYSSHQYIKEEILMPLGLNNTFGSLSEVDTNKVMSGYYVGYDDDLKTTEQGMLATAQDVGVFLRALNDGTVFKAGEQAIYSSIYVYEHTGLVPGYQSIAKYHKEMDAVLVQFTNVTNFEGYNWNLSEVVYGRIVKILERK
ncbi:serine hydrolase [Carboxylicivirga sp. M1479]|uniref:serine hydrolase domain-containing protein n=1 Tax=Carboxylicivirga sp. M1479 TaxID=2594476 RepID=UPI0011787DB5|nr:serine hydrolase domain-containing protein [Carboxylicivirga sp. M1479]TRX66125.1 beta-lactamase family protein [Carboxylicivirga sp. M1479]